MDMFATHGELSAVWHRSRSPPSTLSGRTSPDTAP